MRAPYVAISLFFFCLPVAAQDVEAAAKLPSDRQLVRSAVEDYVEALYQVEPARIRRSVAPELAKLGFGRRAEKDPYRTMAMTFDQLVELAGKWNAKKRVPADAPKKIEVLDVLPRIACAKLIAHWGVDYMQLVKSKDGWRIRHVLWQSAPPEVSTEQLAADRVAIRAAAGDYVDAFYQVKPELADRSVHKDLVKYGFYGAGEKMTPMAMTHDQLRSLAQRAFKGRAVPDTAPREIELLDVQDQTAVVKLVAAWGIDYMHLAKFDDKWQILHVAWQSPPAPAKAGGEQRAKTARAPAAKMAAAVNASCPFSSKPIKASSLAFYGDKVVGFCNPDCRDKFVRSPDRYLAQIPELK